MPYQIIYKMHVEIITDTSKLWKHTKWLLDAQIWWQRWRFEARKKVVCSPARFCTLLIQNCWVIGGTDSHAHSGARLHFYFFENFFKRTQLGMARGIPRPSILEVPELFSLLDSPRNRFYHSSAPRVLAKICRGPRKYWISFLST